MNGISLVGRRVLVTQAEDFMGPALCAAFAAAGAELIADRSAPRQPGSGRAVIESAGHIDALVLNLAIPAPSTPAHQVSDDEWEAAFAALVHPMREMVAAVLPQMIERKAGKIVLMGSASALRGMARRSSYAAARGAQLAYIQAGGRGCRARHPGECHRAELRGEPHLLPARGPGHAGVQGSLEVAGAAGSAGHG